MRFNTIKRADVTELESRTDTLIANAKLTGTISVDGIDTANIVLRKNMIILQTAVNALEESFSGNCCESDKCQTCQSDKCQSCESCQDSCTCQSCQSKTCQSCQKWG